MANVKKIALGTSTYDIVDNSAVHASIDSSPTSGSSNLVTSGGVHQALNNVFKANAVTGSKNIMQNPLESKTVNGITLTVNADKSITLNGTATARTEFTNDQVLKKGSYIFSTEFSGSGSTTGSFIMYSGILGLGSPAQFDIQHHFTGESASFEHSFNVESDVNMRSRFAIVQAGTTLNNVIVKSMIRPAEDSDSTYHKPVMTNDELDEAIAPFTGTVGSSTQPVYLNDGVPTAGFNFSVGDSFIKHDSWQIAFTTAGWYTILAGTSTANNALIGLSLYGGGEHCEYLVHWATYFDSSVVVLGHKGAGTKVSKIRSTKDSSTWGGKALDIYLSENVSTTLFVTIYWFEGDKTNPYTKYTTPTSPIYSAVSGEVELKSGDSIATTGNVTVSGDLSIKGNNVSIIPTNPTGGTVLKVGDAYRSTELPNKINLGDGDGAYISEYADSDMEIYADSTLKLYGNDYLKLIANNDGLVIDADNVSGTAVDTTPTSGSSKLVTSGGVNTALAAKQNKLTAGTGIAISGNNVITATGGGGSATKWYYITGGGNPIGTNIAHSFYTGGYNQTKFIEVRVLAPQSSAFTSLDGFISYIWNTGVVMLMQDKSNGSTTTVLWTRVGVAGGGYLLLVGEWDSYSTSFADNDYSRASYVLKVSPGMVDSLTDTVSSWGGGLYKHKIKIQFASPATYLARGGTHTKNGDYVIGYAKTEGIVWA